MNILQKIKENNLQIYIIILGLLIAIQIFQFAEQRAQFGDFMNKGARFTAVDGNKLCKRIQALEKLGGIEPADCEFLHMQHNDL